MNLFKSSVVMLVMFGMLAVILYTLQVQAAADYEACRSMHGVATAIIKGRKVCVKEDGSILPLTDDQ